MLEKLKAEIMTDVYTIQSDIDSLKTSKLNAFEFYEFKNYAQSWMNKYDNVQTLQWSIKAIGNPIINLVEEHFLKEISNVKAQVSLDAQSIEYKIMSKIDLKESKYQLLELINEKADKHELEKLKGHKVDLQEFEDLQKRITHDDRIGKASHSLSRHTFWAARTQGEYWGRQQSFEGNPRWARYQTEHRGDRTDSEVYWRNQRDFVCRELSWQVVLEERQP